MITAFPLVLLLVLFKLMKCLKTQTIASLVLNSSSCLYALTLIIYEMSTPNLFNLWLIITDNNLITFLCLVKQHNPQRICNRSQLSSSNHLKLISLNCYYVGIHLVSWQKYFIGRSLLLHYWV